MRNDAFSMSSPSKATLQGTGQCVLSAKTHVGIAIWENSIVFPLKLKIRSYNPTILPVVVIQGIEFRVLKSHVHSTSLKHFPQSKPWKPSVCPAWVKKHHTHLQWSFIQSHKGWRPTICDHIYRSGDNTLGETRTQTGAMLHAVM